MVPFADQALNVTATLHQSRRFAVYQMSHSVVNVPSAMISTMYDYRYGVV